QPRDRRLGHLLRQERDQIFEVARVAGAGSRPWHRLQPRPTARDTPQATQLALDDAAAGTEVQVPPALDAAIVDREPSDLPALRADAPLPAQPDRHDHPLGRERDPCYGRPRQAKHPVECGADAHVALPSLLLDLTSQQPAAEGGGASFNN